MQTSPQQGAADRKPALVRGLTLLPATALNMVDMIGVGPFTTLPLMVAAMHGPQAIYGWIAGAVLALSDGLIWAELGAAMPRAGGSYEYLKEIYGPHKMGPSALLPLRLSTRLQRAGLHGHGMHRTGRLCRLRRTCAWRKSSGVRPLPSRCWEPYD